MTDRRIHASNEDGWQLVRYGRAGKWWLEWTGDGPPTNVDALFNRCNIRINRNQRAQIYERQWTAVVWLLQLKPIIGVVGGSAFDREMASYDR